MAGVKQDKKYIRSQAGAYTAETIGAIWLLLLFLAFPLLDLSTSTLRYTFLLAASRNAAHAGAMAKTFMANASSTDLSAVNAAQAAANTAISSFSGVTMTNLTTSIVTTNIASQSISRSTTPLATPGDASLNLYEIECVLNGQIQPLVNCKGNKMLASIPGLTTPIPVQVISREFCESPQGLNQ